MRARIQKLEQAGDLLDHRVVAAGLEEGGPVPPAPLEEVLAPGGIGQHAVDVEDDRRARGGLRCHAQFGLLVSGRGPGTKSQLNGVTSSSRRTDSPFMRRVGHAEK